MSMVILSLLTVPDSEEWRCTPNMIKQQLWKVNQLEVLTAAVPLWLFSFSSFPSPATSNWCNASSAAVLFPRPRNFRSKSRALRWSRFPGRRRQKVARDVLEVILLITFANKYQYEGFWLGSQGRQVRFIGYSRILLVYSAPFVQNSCIPVLEPKSFHPPISVYY